MRKKFVQAAIALAAVVMMASCAKTDQDQVKEVATTFINASLAGDYAKMKECVTPAYAEAIKKAEDMLASMPQEVKAAADEAKKKLAENMPKFTVAEPTINGETAQVTCTSDNPMVAAMGTLVLVKKDGKWLVDMPAVAEQPAAAPATDSIAADSTAAKAPEASKPAEPAKKK